MTSVIRSRAPLWGVLLLALAGLVLGGLRAGGTGDQATPRDDPVPPDKAAVMEGAIDMEGEVAEADAELLQPFADSGPAAEVATVKEAVPQLLTADGATFRVPLDEAAMGARLGAPFAATWSTVARQAQYQEKYDALKNLLAGTLVGHRPYSDNRFVVDAWNGVRVQGLEAFALLDGYDEYLDGLGWVPDPVRQWQVSLLFEDGRWKLAEVYSLDYTTGP